MEPEEMENHVKNCLYRTVNCYHCRQKVVFLQLKDHFASELADSETAVGSTTTNMEATYQHFGKERIKSIGKNKFSLELLLATKDNKMVTTFKPQQVSSIETLRGPNGNMIRIPLSVK